MNNLRRPANACKPLLQFLLFFFVIPFQLNAAIRLPGIFGDNMVLQREKPVHLWGWSKPGAAVSIRFLNKKYTASASAQGKWKISLDPAKAGGPYEMTIADGEEMLKVKNVLIGEVWLCGGQSNMVLDFNSPAVKAKYPDEIAGPANDRIRQVVINRGFASLPAEDCKTSGWKMAGPQTLPAFSATAYFFAKELYERYQVPIGLVNDCYGGTLAEAWTGEPGLTDFPQFTDNGRLLKDPLLLKKTVSNARTAFDQWDQLLAKKDSTDSSGIAGCIQLSFDDAEWKTVKAPGYWDNYGYRNTFGTCWYRKEINLRESWTDGQAMLNLGQPDDADITYFNGVEIGRGANRDIKRRYPVPASLIKPGKNIIAVKVMNYNGTGGINPESRLSITSATDSLSLNDEWKFQPGATMPVKPNLFDPKNLPSSLYNAMIAPVAALTFRGVIWYQGEFNARRAFEYRRLFPALIRNWRETFNDDALPFLFVQLPNFQPLADHPVENDWAELREAQAMALSLPHTGMAVTIDAGGNDLHPANKKPVGVRLSLLARKLVYGEKKLVARGPLFTGMKIKHDRIELRFDDGGSPLITNDGNELRYFSIAGADKKFVWAKAVIRKNKIEVYSPEVPNPVAVRYAWAGNPEGCNLFNKSGLPASPFRTDDWQGITVNNK